MDGKYMVNEKYSFKLSNYARDLFYNPYNITLVKSRDKRIEHSHS